MGEIEQLTPRQRESGLERVRTGDEMTAGVVGCEPGASPEAVAELMASRHVHCVVVAGIRARGTGQRLSWGTISDFDVVCALTGKSGDRTAADLARHSVVTADPTETVASAAERMATNGTTHLVVVKDGRPVGVLSTADVMRVASAA